MTRDEMLVEIDRVAELLSVARARFPSDRALSVVAEALQTLRADVSARWPLGQAYADRMLLGRYAVRNLDADFPNLVVALESLELMVARS
jgi:hypothetical protein